MLSNEPGYYQMSEEYSAEELAGMNGAAAEGKNKEGFGIRIENVVGVVEKEFARGKVQYLGFGLSPSRSPSHID